ncbi:hypothetical protein VNO78_02589 [Psophocarpus tetragonolobus]|uniref:Leucine-rich repeat-containing N-terminal plant-type domain-containing protein n=1 Tax=Psophocarpus tetragonolobus TaxID=3891 RepID=A0AAN9T2R6_PSOTE
MKCAFAVCLFTFVLLEAICCEGCWKEERDALLAFNSPFQYPFSWTGPDCCEWENVECNSSTGRVAKLYLWERWNYWQPNDTKLYINYSDFVVFKDLKELHLSWNGISGCVGNAALLENLEVLDLSHGNLDNPASILSCLDGFSSLKSLYLRDINWFDNSLFKFNTSSLINGLSSSLRNLEILDLSLNNFNDFHNLSNLEYLILDGNSNLKNEVFRSIGELTSLKILSLSRCDINGTLPPVDWFKLRKLEELYLSDNKFKGRLPLSFVNMTSLRSLEISYNHFIGNFDSNIASLTSLEYFGFEENQFEIPISFNPFANHSKLKFIHGEGNKIIFDSQHILQTWIPKFQLKELTLSSTTEANSLPLPKFLLYQNSLTRLDFSSWKLKGDFPHWLLENNTQMTEFLVRNCSFTGTFQLPLHPLPKIQTIDVSENIIIGQIPKDNMSLIYPNLNFLNMSRNQIQGSIPHEFGQIHSLYHLDLSDNQLSGKIPGNIFGVEHQLNFLKLSNNKLEGSILTIPNGLETLLLNNNGFTGRIPKNIFNTSIISLDISNNHLVGKISSLIKNLSRLEELYLSNNHFEGSIPLELGELEDLIYLDLSQNNFFGLVPAFTNSSVKFIHLNNNHFNGLSKGMFNRNSSLVMLDLSYNEISNNLQDLTQNLSSKWMNFLILKGNHFTGDIPKQICQLIDLNILDLSHNNLSGFIPNCLGKMPFENKYPKKFLKIFFGWSNQDPFDSTILNAFTTQLPNVQEKANFTSKKRTDIYMASILVYMSAIDLSHNKLKGNIPFELGNMTKLRALNLSHNDLTGKIPTTFSHLVQIESLDLSFNMLNGQIPPQLDSLTSLEVFSLAHNNLSGSTPEWKGQFSTFDESSYEGNPFLCGPPLTKSCNTPPTIVPNDSNTNRDDDCLVDMFIFCVSFVVSYTSTLLVIAVTLYINPYWRQAWFYYMELMSMNCYYFIMDNLSKFLKLKICNIY